MGKHRNLITTEMVEKLRADFEGSRFGHMRTWAAQTHTRQMILVSRQIGSTSHFLRQGFLVGLEEGRNQFFIGNDRLDAASACANLMAWVHLIAGVKLVGKDDGHGGTLIEIERGEGLPNVWVQFRVGTKWSPVGWHGDVTLSDFFWSPHADMLFKFADAIAWHKGHRVICYSAINREKAGWLARFLWAGQIFKRLGTLPRKYDFSHRALRDGHLGSDGIWRQIVTIDDAMEGGMKLFHKRALIATFCRDEFEELFLCRFGDEKPEGQFDA